MKIICVFFLLLTCAPGAIAQWSRINGTASSDEYVDLSTRKQLGTIVSMWAMSDRFSPENTTKNRSYQSQKLLFEYDCVATKVRVNSLVYYSGRMGGGDVVFHSEARGEWYSVVPGSVGEVRFEKACLQSVSGNAAALDADFDLVNRASESILFLYVSPVSSKSWGNDRLGDERTISSGNRYTVRLPRDGECFYDIRVQYSQNRVEDRRNQNLCELSTMVFDGSTMRLLNQATHENSSGSPQSRSAVTSNPPVSSRAQVYGTAFFISSQGLAVTNNHVVNGCARLVAQHEGRQFAASILRRDDRNDLALLRVHAKVSLPYAPFRASPSIRAGETVVVAGYPLQGVLQNGINITLGNVSALVGLGGNGALMQITAPVQPGNSGGPLLDMAGNVVGVVVSKLNAARVAQVTGDIPQNINFAVHAALVRLLAESSGYRVEERSSAKEHPVADVSDRARRFTFQLECGQ